VEFSKRKNSFAVYLIIALAISALSAREAGDTEKILRTVAGAVIKDATFQFIDRQNGQRYALPAEAPSNAQLRPESRYNDWRYWNGVLNLAMIRLGDILPEPSYRDFAARNVAFGFDNYRYFEDRHTSENKWDYPFGQFFIMEELDDCGAMGASVIEVSRSDPKSRYGQYLEKAAAHILHRQARLEDGTLVRSFPRKWTLWADDLYMSISFLSRMGEIEGWSLANKGIENAVCQVINFHKYLFDEKKGLMCHNWYSDSGQPGVAYWGRANGWAILAQIDLLERLPADYPRKDTLLALFRRHVEGIVRYQSESGLWHQLLDKDDSYLETSCTAMFIYAIARAVNHGYLSPDYRSVAVLGWQGILTKIRPDGQIEGVCTGTSISDDLKDYYVRPAPLNDVHGIGLVILAGAEILNLSR